MSFVQDYSYIIFILELTFDHIYSFLKTASLLIKHRITVDRLLVVILS